MSVNSNSVARGFVGVSGRCLSEASVRARIENGEYAITFRDAIQRFGLDFVAVAPVYKSCCDLILTQMEPGGSFDGSCCYVPRAVG